MLAANGGSVLFYVVGHDKTLIRRLVEFLQQSDFAGVIFTKQPMEGTFGLTQAQIQNGDAPDVVMAFRWDRFTKSIRRYGRDRRRLATSGREGDSRHAQPVRHAQHVDRSRPGF